MPSYVSHTIMAKDIYNKLNDKNIDLNYLLTYSLGPDLSKYSKCRYKTHRLDIRETFMNNLFSYAQKNSLLNDKKIKGVLYGHIIHFSLDDTMHPLVRKMSKVCKNNKKNHSFLETCYDAHLVDEKYNIPLNKYDNKKLFKGKLNKDIKNMLNYAYEKTFDEKNISKYYIFNIFLYKKIKYLYLLFPLTLLKKVLGVEKFLKENKNIDLLNKNHKIKYYDVSGKPINYDFDKLYQKAIEKAIEDINKINEKYYDL